jgi:hypothetical protein
MPCILRHRQLHSPKKDPKDKKAKPTCPIPAPKPCLKGENKLVPGKLGKAVLNSPVMIALDTPLGNFQRHEPFSLSLWLQTPDEKERAVVLHRSQAWTDAASRGYELLIEEGKHQVVADSTSGPATPSPSARKDKVPLNAMDCTSS